MRKTTILLLALTMFVGLSNVASAHPCIDWHPCDCGPPDRPTHVHICLIGEDQAANQPDLFEETSSEADTQRSVVLI